MVFAPIESNANWAPVASQDLLAWEASEGDFLTVDLSTNTGYLNSLDGTVAEFPVVSGQKNVVNYIGLRYWAETPQRSWVIKNATIKPDRVTFGNTGSFLRMWDANGFTHYGIHAYRYGEGLLSLEEDNRYQSMGCILVSESVLDKIEEVLDANAAHGLRVVTYKG